MHFSEIQINSIKLFLGKQQSNLSQEREISWLRNDYFNLQSAFARVQTESVLFFGAGSGLIPLYLAASKPHAKICVVEPVKKVVQSLRRCAKQNFIDNIFIFEGAYSALQKGNKATLVMQHIQDHLCTSMDCNDFDSMTSVEDTATLTFSELLKYFEQQQFSMLFFSCGILATESIIADLTPENCIQLLGFFGENTDPLAIKNLLKTRRINAFLRGAHCSDFIEESAGRDPVLLSVIVPMYNVSAYLPQCLDSLISAIPSHTEIIAVNDGSVDDSATIVENWKKVYPFIRLINKENGGCASARSTGLHEAIGEYVAFVDPDDWLFPDSLTRLCRAAVLGSTDIVQGGFVKYYEMSGKSKLINEDEVVRDYQYGITEQGKIRSLLILQPTIWRRVYKRYFLLENNLDFYHQIRCFDDLPFQFEALSVCRSFKAIPDLIYNYRLENPGQDVASNDNKLFVHFDIFSLLDNFVRRLGCQQVIEQLMRVKLYSHSWALGRIRSEFKKQYIKRAQADIQVSKDMLGGAEYNRIIAERRDWRKLSVYLDSFSLLNFYTKCMEIFRNS
jgi:glycosyltransferase involved in cell wall biosynthesis